MIFSIITLTVHYFFCTIVLSTLVYSGIKYCILAKSALTWDVKKVKQTMVGCLTLQSCLSGPFLARISWRWSTFINKKYISALFVKFLFLFPHIDWQVTHRPMWVRHWRPCTGLNLAKPPSVALRTCSSASKMPASSNPSCRNGWRRLSKPVVSHQPTLKCDFQMYSYPPPFYCSWANESIKAFHISVICHSSF